MRKRSKLLSRPILAAILVFAVLAVGLVGCSKSKSKEQAKPPTPEEQQNMMKQMQKTVPQQQ